MNEQEEGPIWYVMIDAEVTGPMTWDDVSRMKRNGDLSNEDMMKNVSHSRWYPVPTFFPDRGKTTLENEMKGILPKASDLIFILGLIAFFVGAGVYFLIPLVGDLILIASLALEIWSVYYSGKKEPEAVTKKVGNIFAIIWIVFQGLLTLLFLVFTFS